MFEDNYHPGLSWWFFTLLALAYGAIAVVSTAYLAPGAAGGGTAELMGLFNGVNYP